MDFCLGIKFKDRRTGAADGKLAGRRGGVIRKEKKKIGGKKKAYKIAKIYIHGVAGAGIRFSRRGKKKNNEHKCRGKE